ncbi:MAG TPA: hypothetical protein VJK06_05065 [Methyloceanibacter sp.]|nr:hypothetical protein [Methyloceanibacter sp.]
MFGVRIIVFACTLFGVAVSLPLDLAEAKPHHSSRGSYSQYLRKPYAKQHARKSYAKHHTRKSHVQQSSRKTTAKLHVKASASASVGLGARPARWCGWWMRSQKGGGPELNLARNWAQWGRPTAPQVGAVVVWQHHVGMITGRTASGQWIVKSGNDGGRVRERPRSVAGAVFRTDSSA